MKVRIQMVFEAEDGKPEVIEEVGQLQRGPLRPSELGLSLAEAKSLLHGMQQSMVAEQVEHYLGQFKACEHCSAQRTKKGQHTIVFRTLFGKLHINSPRLYDCAGQNHGRRSSSPLSELLASHCAPELSCLQTKFASLMSYGLSVDLLSEVLPLANEINPRSMRRQLQGVAQRIESELGEERPQFIEGCCGKTWASCATRRVCSAHWVRSMHWTQGCRVPVWPTATAAST